MIKMRDNITICKRENNKKRNYVIVNKHQGKHYPIRPSKVYKEVQSLYDKAKETKALFDIDTRKIVIGFAETATGIGAIFSKLLEFNDKWYLTTTRENISVDDKYICIDFKEEHSHAVAQRLYCNKEIFSKDFDLIFVEDEITTGNTLKNTIEAMNNAELLNKCKSICICSLLNGMTNGDLNNFYVQSYNEIVTEFIYNDKIEGKEVYSEYANSINLSSNSECYKDLSMSKCNLESKHLSMGSNPRLGINVKEYVNSLNGIKEFTMNYKDYTNTSVRIIGTEECMFPALELGLELENNFSSIEVLTHSTTRSPIEAGEYKDYPLKSRCKLRSLYEYDRITYLYNVLEDDNRSDLVIIITDSYDSNSIEKGIEDLVSLYSKCKAKEILIFRLES